MAKNKYYKIGSVLKSKENEKEFYLKLNADTTFVIKNKEGEVIKEIDLEAGACLAMQTPTQEVEFLVENDHITEEEGEERLENVPDFVKYLVKAPTPAEETKSKSSKSGKSSKESKKPNRDDDF